jgi:hypothetical protein
VVILLLGALANADDWGEIEIFGQKNEKMLKKYIELGNRIPSHDRIERVMGSIKPEVMKGLFWVWRKMCDEVKGERIKKILNIDGKRNRGSGNKNEEALRIVSAWSKEEGICFVQKEE